MNRSYKSSIRFLIVFLFLISLAGPFLVTGEDRIQSTGDFVDKLESVYGDVADFSAQLTISGAKEPLRVEVLAISEPRILRVEYLSPSDMEDQFFLVEEDFLYDYRPMQNMIIEKDLKESNLPVKAANLTPDYLLELVRSEELNVNLISGPGRIFFPWEREDVLKFEMTVPWLKETNSTNSVNGQGLTTPVPFDSGTENYVLQISPKVEGYQFARQVIRFGPDDFLPRELVTYFEEEGREPIRTGVEELEINPGLDRENITSLPEDAQVISG